MFQLGLSTPSVWHLASWDWCLWIEVYLTHTCSPIGYWTSHETLYKRQKHPIYLCPSKQDSCFRVHWRRLLKIEWPLPNPRCASLKWGRGEDCAVVKSALSNFLYLCQTPERNVLSESPDGGVTSHTGLSGYMPKASPSRVLTLAAWFTRACILHRQTV